MQVQHMIKKLRNLAVATGSAAMLFSGALPRPAAADTTSTILTAAAVVGGLILYNNYQHKRQEANQVVGYTRNGGTILGDGRILMPNGQTYYPDANGRYPWGQYAYYNPQFQQSNVGYDYNHSGQWDSTHRHDNGLHRGWYKNDNGWHRGDEHSDRDDRNHGHHG
jgi:hypothetical protein